VTAGLRVAVADDSVLVRRGVVQVLESCGCTVVGAVGTADELLRLVAAEPVDAAVVDVRMPPTHRDEGLEAMERLRERGVTAGVLLLSAYVSTPSAMRVLATGRGTGYLLKDRVAREDVLFDAVRTVAAGGSVVDPEVVAVLTARRHNARQLDALSAREREVLGLMAQGRSNRWIATDLHVSAKTLETHIGRILLKLDIEESTDDHRRVLAVLRWLGGVE
jgi:DNA-binding NarL/FixJ family response regulator